MRKPGSKERKDIRRLSIATEAKQEDVGGLVRESIHDEDEMEDGEWSEPEDSDLDGEDDEEEDDDRCLPTYGIDPGNMISINVDLPLGVSSYSYPSALELFPNTRLSFLNSCSSSLVDTLLVTLSITLNPVSIF